MSKAHIGELLPAIFSASFFWRGAAEHGAVRLQQWQHGDCREEALLRAHRR